VQIPPGQQGGGGQEGARALQGGGRDGAASKQASRRASDGNKNNGGSGVGGGGKENKRERVVESEHNVKRCRKTRTQNNEGTSPGSVTHLLKVVANLGAEMSTLRLCCAAKRHRQLLLLRNKRFMAVDETMEGNSLSTSWGTGGLFFYASSSVASGEEANGRTRHVAGAG
jgi:hypothetical protein